jgi:hypothetical protein
MKLIQCWVLIGDTRLLGYVGSFTSIMSLRSNLIVFY